MKYPTLVGEPPYDWLEDQAFPGLTNQKGTEVIQTIANHPGRTVHNLTREDLENRIDDLETLLGEAYDELFTLIRVSGLVPDETIDLVRRIHKSLPS